MLMLRKIRHYFFISIQEISTSLIMPKHDKQVKKPVKAIESGPISSKINGTILIKISAKPGAKQNAITDINEENVSVHINAAPVEGAANTELVKYLASGSKSRDKIISISNEHMTREKILEKLQKEKSTS
uniref:Uncharacterized protein n=1 Tax=Strigamia maritima TaxID=126957 RepID=T1JKV8_STRMM